MAGNLANHLTAHPDLNLADVAHTLQHGRRAFACRRTVVAGTRAEAIERLTDLASEFTNDNDGETIPRGGNKATFMFPGQGAQYVGMTRDLYDSCLLYTSPSPRDRTRSRMPSSA